MPVQIDHEQHKHTQSQSKTIMSNIGIPPSTPPSETPTQWQNNNPWIQSLSQYLLQAYSSSSPGQLPPYVYGVYDSLSQYCYNASINTPTSDDLQQFLSGNTWCGDLYLQQAGLSYDDLQTFALGLSSILNYSLLSTPSLTTIDNWAMNIGQYSYNTNPSQANKTLLNQALTSFQTFGTQADCSSPTSPLLVNLQQLVFSNSNAQDAIGELQSVTGYTFDTSEVSQLQYDLQNTTSGSTTLWQNIASAFSTYTQTHPNATDSEMTTWFTNYLTSSNQQNQDLYFQTGASLSDMQTVTTFLNNFFSLSKASAMSPPQPTFADQMITVSLPSDASPGVTALWNNIQSAFSSYANSNTSATDAGKWIANYLSSTQNGRDLYLQTGATYSDMQTVCKFLKSCFADTPYTEPWNPPTYTFADQIIAGSFPSGESPGATALWNNIKSAFSSYANSNTSATDAGKWIANYLSSTQNGQDLYFQTHATDPDMGAVCAFLQNVFAGTPYTGTFVPPKSTPVDSWIVALYHYPPNQIQSLQNPDSVLSQFVSLVNQYVQQYGSGVSIDPSSLLSQAIQKLLNNPPNEPGQANDLQVIENLTGLYPFSLSQLQTALQNTGPGPTQVITTILLNAFSAYYNPKTMSTSDVAAWLASQISSMQDGKDFYLQNASALQYTVIGRLPPQLPALQDVCTALQNLFVEDGISQTFTTPPITAVDFMYIKTLQYLQADPTSTQILQFKNLLQGYGSNTPTDSTSPLGKQIQSFVNNAIAPYGTFSNDLLYDIGAATGIWAPGYSSGNPP